MGLYGSFKSLFRGKTPYSGWGGLGGGYRPYSVWLPGTTYDYTEMLIQGLWKNSTVASGIDWLARNWSVPNLQVVRVDDEGIEDPIHNHPALTLLRRPHPYVGEAAFVGAYVRDASCYGNVWIEKIKNRLGEPVELKIWRADKVSPLFPTDGSDYLTAWRYNINGKMLDVPADRVIHIRRYIDMDQDRVGWSPLLAHVREIAVLNEASTYTASPHRQPRTNQQDKTL
jgi:phage portal protein BeeE